MALTLNTNLAALNAANQLSRSLASSNQALERLSSGLRINSARDDAAGLAIASRFEAQISGQTVARRNAGDGISLAQTAEGALEAITNNLQRVRDLSLQAANATNGNADRAALDDEVQQRLEEIDRIARQTTFNGLNVLDGSLETLRFQVGANVGQTIDLSMSQGARVDQMGAVAEVDLAFADGVFNEDGELEDPQSFNVRIGDGAVVSLAFDAGATLDDIRAELEAADIDGVFNLEVDEDGIRFFSDDVVSLGGGDIGQFFEDPPEEVELSGSLAGSDIRTVESANITLVRVDDALDAISGLRSQLGAVQNRFESTINNLNNSIENLSASRSRIMDADFAAEISSLIRAQILQQAGIAILAQANARPQQILSLLP